MKTEQQEKQFSKVLIFKITEEDDWEEDIGAWRHKAQQVYRKPQGDWTVVDGGTTRFIYFIPQLSGSADTDPNTLDLPEWVSCYWDPQAGRWIMMLSGGGQSPQFFWLNEVVTTQQEVEAIVGSYTAVGSGDPETIINWGAESEGSGGENLLDGAPEGYLALCVPVKHTEDNPDYQPNPEEPDFDPRETITKTIWPFAQGRCVGSTGGSGGNQVFGGSATSTPTAVYNGGDADSLPVQDFGVDGGNAA